MQPTHALRTPTILRMLLRASVHLSGLEQCVFPCFATCMVYAQPHDACLHMFMPPSCRLTSSIWQAMRMQLQRAHMDKVGLHAMTCGAHHAQHDIMFMF